MATSIDLGSIKRRVYTTYFQDGLLELLLGLSLVFWGALFLADLGYMMWLPWVLLSGLPGAKKRYVSPRVGYVNVGPHRKTRARLVLAGVVLLTLLALLGAMVFVLTTRQELPAWLKTLLDALFKFGHFGVVLAVILAAVFAFFGNRSGIARLYAFALLFVLTGLVTSVLDIAPAMRLAILLLGAGGVVMISGLVVFLRFLREHPLPAEGAAEDPAEDAAEDPAEAAADGTK